MALHAEDYLRRQGLGRAEDTLECRRMVELDRLLAEHRGGKRPAPPVRLRSERSSRLSRLGRGKLRDQPFFMFSSPLIPPGLALGLAALVLTFSFFGLRVSLFDFWPLDMTYS